MDVARACEEEIVGLHRFFEAWFRGAFSDRERGFRRFADVMDPGFVIVSPRGTATALPDLSKGLRGAFGTWKPDDAIEVRDVQLRHLHADLAVLTYIEAQRAGGKETARLSTVLMREDESTPNGIRWLHVHETWMPGQAG
ncbi:MAG: hypothetical protein AAGA54_26025 [Myxococcota bacterium]